MGEGQGPHLHEQDLGRTIRDTGEREWGAHRDTEGESRVEVLFPVHSDSERSGMRLLFGLALVVSGAALQAAGHRPLAPAFGRSRLRPTTLSVVDIYSVADEWVRAAPYQSAFCITAFKATIADCITQARELAAHVRIDHRHCHGFYPLDPIELHLLA